MAFFAGHLARASLVLVTRADGTQKAYVFVETSAGFQVRRLAMPLNDREPDVAARPGGCHHGRV
jgi:hypothetical protein